MDPKWVPPALAGAAQSEQGGSQGGREGAGIELAEACTDRVKVDVALPVRLMMRRQPK